MEDDAHYQVSSHTDEPMRTIAVALVSIAISQKRQADSMDRLEKAGTVTPEVMSDLLHDFKHG